MTDRSLQEAPETQPADAGWLPAQAVLQLVDGPDLFVARHKVSRLFSLRIQNFLLSCEDWRKTSRPTIEQVQAELSLSAGRHPLWTTDLQNAECWTRDAIAQFHQFVPALEFCVVELQAVPAG